MKWQHVVRTGSDAHFLTSTILGIRESVQRIHSNAREIAHGNNDLFPYGRAGGRAAGDSGQHGADQNYRASECR